MTKNRLFCIPLLMAAAMAATAGNVSYTTNPQTGAVSSISIDGDTTRMDWMLRTDGKQYAWVTERYGWGLGYMTVNGKRYEWRNPEKSSGDGGAVSYKAGGISIEVSRKPAEGGFTESYTFINNSGADARLIDMGIYTPFNDNYPDSRECMAGRCNAHIWPGGNAAYVNAVRMRGTGGGVGLAVTEGSIAAYDVWERGREKGMSNYRGVIALCPPDTVLRSGGRMSVTWRVFSHEGSSDFRDKLISYGGAVVSSPKYVYETGETATVEIETAEGKRTVSRKITGPGEVTVSLAYGNGKTTFAQLLGVSSYEGLIAKRIGFILDRQQMNDPADPRYGAFMVYDNELGKIYLNDGARASSDTDEGRERVGMGLLLAKWYARHPDGRLREALVRYAAFIRNRLQTADYTTYSKASKTGKIRGYNYPWIADFYFHMYGITGDRQYAEHGYGTMRAFFRRFKYGFYAIDIPVTESMRALAKAGMKAERDTLLADYRQTADVFIRNGLDFPKHEVNYEQSIVAPAVQFMAEMYLATRDKQYLDCASMIMPALEAFTGLQPAYNMNEIAIRHWDGYWFGKRQLFGDTFPHYWSALNASAYHYYSLCTGDRSWQRRAENIVRNNLCLFFEDGRASCAFLNPRMVNGERAHYYDVFANDQDWALVWYLLVNS